ncbi:MAG: YceD family protein [Acidimicrobiia bacterium]
MTGLRMNISDLLRRPGSTRQVHLEVPLEGLENLSARVEDTEPLVLDLRLEGLTGAIVASGRVQGRWAALCSRCLAPLHSDFDLRLREVFEEDPVEEETYPLHHEEIDLEQPLRDLVVPELPIVPLCRPDCAGLCATCGGNRNEGECGCETVPADPRWEALRDLEL